MSVVRDTAAPARSLSRTLMTPAIVLLALWFVPDALSSPPRFAYQLIGPSRGLSLVAVLASPVAAALVVLVSAMMRRERAVARASLPLALTACLMPLFGYYRLPVGAHIAAVVMLGAVASHVVLGRIASTRSAAWLALAIPPVTLLVVVCAGLFSGDISPYYIASIKTPVALYAAMLMASASASVLANELVRRSSPRT